MYICNISRDSTDESDSVSRHEPFKIDNYCPSPGQLRISNSAPCIAYKDVVRPDQLSLTNSTASFSSVLSNIMTLHDIASESITPIIPTLCDCASDSVTISLSDNWDAKILAKCALQKETRKSDVMQLHNTVLPCKLNDLSQKDLRLSHLIPGLTKK